MRNGIVLSVLLLLTTSACTPLLPEFKRTPVPKDQEAFTFTINEFRSTHQVRLLQQFRSDYPSSSWAKHAETLELYALEVEQRKKQLDESRTEVDQLKHALTNARAETGALESKRDALTLENQQLKEQIEQLKGLLIQLEQRAQ